MELDDKLKSLNQTILAQEVQLKKQEQQLMEVVKKDLQHSQVVGQLAMSKSQVEAMLAGVKEDCGLKEKSLKNDYKLLKE